ncbi:MbcA/ParS/Xre antitoxin family protein [Thalassotalea sp. PP2-459]|uniref:MbcA/ParS/Xre antitoxin family protein n=1 Tax=Thalassotalea sp. PP2-459 TaxID=1742724 RepID=UPI0009433269|nr:MbcA/ParS/Xre antitoxin family protein [Thalassotalea sp. PP2-459]OKY25123.1 hypothetical protein BI291_03670 [Thalassotalea sp. PP2-459]
MKNDDLATILARHPKIHSSLLEVFKKEDVALRWLKSPRIQLGNKAPIDVLADDESAVEDLLYRIKTGDFS